jgi:hypothetical protein
MNIGYWVLGIDKVSRPLDFLPAKLPNEPQLKT